MQRIFFVFALFSASIAHSSSWKEVESFAINWSQVDAKDLFTLEPQGASHWCSYERFGQVIATKRGELYIWLPFSKKPEFEALEKLKEGFYQLKAQAVYDQMCILLKGKITMRKNTSISLTLGRAAVILMAAWTTPVLESKCLQLDIIYMGNFGGVNAESGPVGVKPLKSGATQVSLQDSEYAYSCEYHDGNLAINIKHLQSGRAATIKSLGQSRYLDFTFDLNEFRSLPTPTKEVEVECKIL